MSKDTKEAWEASLDIPPIRELTRPDEVAELLVDAVDLHCHSGPAVMPRILSHVDALKDCMDAKFKALLYKDHYYGGMNHAIILESLFPDSGVRLFSGLALNNASGGINPHAVDHALRLGAKIIWMPTLAAKNHVDQTTGAAKNFPGTTQKMLDPIPLTCLAEDGTLTDATKQVIDLIAAADVILAGGHLHVTEQHVLFDEAKRRGVKKMMVNHPTYLIGCSDEDIRQLTGQGVTMEHSICMFVEGRSYKYDGEKLKHLVEVAGVDKTIFSSDLGLRGAPRPVDGYRSIVQTMLDLQIPKADIRTLISTNASRMLNLPA